MSLASASEMFVSERINCPCTGPDKAAATARAVMPAVRRAKFFKIFLSSGASGELLPRDEQQDQHECHRFDGGYRIQPAGERAGGRLQHPEEPRRTESGEIGDGVDQ